MVPRQARRAIREVTAITYDIRNAGIAGKYFLNILYITCAYATEGSAFELRARIDDCRNRHSTFPLLLARPRIGLRIKGFLIAVPLITSAQSLQQLPQRPKEKRAD